LRAKRSNPAMPKERLDCFASLAMTLYPFESKPL